MKIATTPARRTCPHCGEPVEGAAGRSVPQLRRFFALLRIAHANWPEAHERQFASPEELRAWVLCKVGHSEIVGSIPLSGVRPAQAAMLAEAAFRAARSLAFAVPRGGTLEIVRPKSIAFRKLGPDATQRVMAEAEAVLAAEMGITLEELGSSHETREDRACLSHTAG